MQTLETDCLFCKIARREIPAEILHESDKVVAFRDLDPKAPSHILLIPKVHISSAEDITESDGPMLADLFRAATHLAATEGIAESGWRLVTNVGADGGQSVFHLHFHLLGGRHMAWPPG